MALRLYFDVHVWKAVTDGCRFRGIEGLTAQEDKAGEFDDDSLLQRATELGRILFTFDSDFPALAKRWLDSGRSFAGIIYAHEMAVTVRQCIDDLELITQAAEPDELKDVVLYLPLKSR
jgi:Domain of unknown function (DUF5615)